MTYDPVEYWTRRGQRYREELRNRRHGKAKRMFDAQEAVLPNLVTGLAPESVLEVGCGYGRMTGLMPSSIKVYDAVDVSPTEIGQAKLSTKGVNFHCDDFMEWKPYRRYDLVFACEVLMHIPPDIVSKFMGKMLLLSMGRVLNLDYFEPNRTLKNLTLIRLHEGNFNHDYPALYRSLGAKDIEQIHLSTKRWYGKETHPQSIFVARV